jgi:Tol biopolymer transport system component
MERAWRRGAVCLLANAALLAVPALGEAAFPGANGPIAFERIVGPGAREIFTMEPDGSGQQSITDPLQLSSSPAYSPDGTLIAFERDNDIWVMRSDGSKPRAVVDDPGNGQPIDAEPSFSPDGERIVFSRDTNLNLSTQDEIFTVDLGSGELANLTENGSDLDDQPTYSPDGSKIAWIRNEHGPAGPDEIFVMDADGGNPQNLTTFGAENSTTSPDYAPDGSLIAFAHDGDIWTMDAEDGSNKQDITPSPMIGETDPAYSPDGSQIAFARDTGGAPTVDEIFSLGAGLTNLTNSALEDFGPAWGPLDTELNGSASAKKKQKQKGSKIVVKVKVKAGEDLTAKATGKVKVNPTYKLKPVSKSVSSGKSKKLKLRPKKTRDARKIAKALKRGKKAKAKLKVKLSDGVGNKKVVKLSVKLKR